MKMLAIVFSSFYVFFPLPNTGKTELSTTTAAAKFSNFPAEAMVDMFFPVFCMIWVSTVDLRHPELDFALGRWW